MKGTGVGATADVIVRDLLSSLTALAALSMAMTDTGSEDEILNLGVAALPSLSRRCRPEAVWLDGEWRSVDCLRGGVGPRTGLEAQIVSLPGTGGALRSPDLKWVWAFPLSSRGGASGFLVVGAPEPPPDHEWSLIQALAQTTGMALANGRLLARERVARARIVDEQATLRRLGTLVAEAALPEEVFTAVAAEAGRLLEADFAVVSRYDADGAATVLGAWAKAGGTGPFPPGTRVASGDLNVHTRVFEAGGPVRIEDYGNDGQGAMIARRWGITSVVGVPIQLGGRRWGVIGVASKGEEPLPADTEAWLAGFTELVTIAVANAQAAVELSGFAEEQAALRRVATLVARAAEPEQVFAAVTAEVGRLLNVDFTVLSRYEGRGAVAVIGAWARVDLGRTVPVGLRLDLSGHNVHTAVARTGRPARIDYSDASGPPADVARQWGFHSAVGAPIDVEGRLWGVISVGSGRDEALPPDTEARLYAFTELVGAALANAEAQGALTASRARIVAAADTARRRIERDLHDGAQQRLVSLALQVRAARAAVPPAAGELAAELDKVAEGLAGAMEELREIAGGIHPAALTKGGLASALRSLARRSAVPVELDIRVDGRLPEPIELAAYHVVAEALTNTAKHAGATGVNVEVAVIDNALRVAVRDDGCGGADVSRGSGIVGLTDRVEALGGRISLHSPPGAGTILEIALPLQRSQADSAPTRL